MERFHEIFQLVFETAGKSFLKGVWSGKDEGYVKLFGKGCEQRTSNWSCWQNAFFDGEWPK